MVFSIAQVWANGIFTFFGLLFPGIEGGGLNLLGSFHSTSVNCVGCTLSRIIFSSASNRADTLDIEIFTSLVPKPPKRASSLDIL